MMKALLVLAIVGLSVGMVLNSGLVHIPLDALYAVLPLGAVFAGLYMIGKLLEKESATFDQEQEATARRVSGGKESTGPGMAGEQNTLAGSH
ncbi:MAG TPA: hypothetical protein VEC99_09315 [Clostridia bacterium]|nr:hypothetical protein [Clostridia bacterium]